MPASTVAPAPRTIPQRCGRTGRVSPPTWVRRNLLSAYQVHGTTALVVDEAWPAGYPPAGGRHGDGQTGPRAWGADGRLRAGAARRASCWGRCRGPCRLARRLGRHRRGHSGRHGGPGRQAGAHSGRPSAPASAKAPTRWDRNSRPQFLRQDAASDRFFTRTHEGSRPRFDLPGYVAERLRQAGIEDAGGLEACTYAQGEDFFSYRRSRARDEPDYGRQISAIVLT